MSKQSVADSKARLEAEIRALVPKIAHHPLKDVKALVDQRCRTSVDVAFLRELGCTDAGRMAR